MVYNYDIDSMRGNMIKQIIVVVRKRWKIEPQWVVRTSEQSYYISTTNMSADKYNKYIRNHRWIENRCHYVKDVSMWEDNSRIRIKPRNFWICRDLALNIMRANWETSIWRSLYINALDIKKVFQYKYVF